MIDIISFSRVSDFIVKEKGDTLFVLSNIFASLSNEKNVVIIKSVKDFEMMEEYFTIIKILYLHQKKYTSLNFLDEYYHALPSGKLIPYPPAIMKKIASFVKQLTNNSSAEREDKIHLLQKKFETLPKEHRDEEKDIAFLHEAVAFADTNKFYDSLSPFSNPHCLSRCLSSLGVGREDLLETPPFLLSSIDGRLEYQTRCFNSKIHSGQRKLFLETFEFLTLFVNPQKENIVIYAGAAPGNNSRIISKLFPQVYFILVDPNPFSVKKSKTIEIRQEYFTDEMCDSLREKYSDEKYNVLFISDIRTIGPTFIIGKTDEQKRKEQCELEAQVISDHLLQEGWVRKLKPKAASLKFRLPYSSVIIKTRKEGEITFYECFKNKISTNSHPVFNEKGDKFIYLDGEVYLQQWAPRGSTETRLIVTDPDSTKEWDYIEYEEKLSYFNNRIRNREFVSKDEYLFFSQGYDRCCDCQSEIMILEQFISENREAYSTLEKNLEKEYGKIVHFSSIDAISSRDEIEKRDITSVINLSYYISKIVSGGKNIFKEYVSSNKKYRGNVVHRTAAPNKY